MSKEKIRFDSGTVWHIQTGKIKIYIPNIIDKDFNTYCKKNKIKLLESSVYRYQDSKQTKMNLAINEGKDYVINREHKEDLIKWLKASYREIKI